MKKGMTIIELIVTFTLVSTVAVVLFQIAMIVQGIYNKYETTTEMLSDVAIISNQLNNELLDKQIIMIEACIAISNCYEFTYSDYTKDVLKYDEMSIIFGDFKKTFINNVILSDIKIDNFISPVTNEFVNDSFITIKIEVTSEQLDEKFYINVLHQYNSNYININI